MAQHLSGEGDVLLSKTQAFLTRARYELDVTEPAEQGGARHTDVAIELDQKVAEDLLKDGTLATLRTEDGRQEISFCVTHVGGEGDVRVRATGGLRPTQDGSV